MLWGRHRGDPGKWTKKDLALAEALVIYEGSLCRGCGHSATHAYDPFNAGEYVVEDDTYCLACEALENRADEKLGAGQKRFVKNLIGSPDPNEPVN